jgi:hypothetical protein
MSSACQSPPSESGIRLGDETLAQFQTGVTTEHWLISVIGPPTTRTDILDGSEPVSVLRYTTKEASSGLLSMFQGAGERTTATVYFIVRAGVVTQFWADRNKQPSLLGKQVEEEKGEKQ